jgi:hypothetical protein
MTFAPILSKQGPDVGLEREVYSPDLFNNTTGFHTSQGATYPINMTKDVSNELYYFGGAQTISGSGPVYILQPTNQSAAVGTTVIGFGCQATDNSTSSETLYSWYVILSGSHIPTAYTTGVTRGGTPGTFVSYSSVIVPTTAEYNGSSWYVIASNPSGSTQSNTATLTITGVTTAPVITEEGYATAENLADGGTYNFSTKAWGDPTLSFEWHKVTVGSTVGGAGDSIVATNAGTDNGAPYHIFTSTYTTTTLYVADSGVRYYCKITNPYGTTLSTICTLTVGVAPVISSTLSAVTVTEGSSFTVTTTLSAGTPAGYYWYVQDTNTPPFGGTATWPDVSNFTNTSSFTYTPTYSQNGKYIACWVLNSFGSVNSNVVSLTVNAAVTAAPTVTTNPTSGAGPTFTAVFTGSYLTFQWQQYGIYDVAWSNSSIISTTPNTQTSILDLSTLSSGYDSLNGYQFRCVASNGTGSATTTAATLIIGAPPVTLSSVTVSPSSATVNGAWDHAEFTATGHWSDASTTNITNGCSWFTSDPTFLAVNIPGQVYDTGLFGSGSKTVTASYYGISNTATVTMAASALSSVTIAPLNSSVAVGSTVAYVATAHYANAATSNVTDFSGWISGTPAYATIGNNGLYGLGWGYPTASGIASGTTTIHAVTGYPSINSVSSSNTNLTVTGGGGGGGGGSSTYARPTTGTGSTNFAGAIDTTSASIDYSTFTSTATSSPTESTNIFSGFGTGTVSGTLNVRVEASTESMPNIDDTLFAKSLMLLAYSYNGGSYVTMVSAFAGTGDPSAATPISVSLSGVDLSTLLVKLVYRGDRTTGTLAERGVASVNVTLYDVVFLTS